TPGSGERGLMASWERWQNPIDVEWVWKHRHMSYREMAANIVGRPTGIALRGHLRALGFKRAPSRKWVVVPCRVCGERTEANDTWTCEGCPDPDVPTGPLPEWKRLYDEELARVMAKREKETERVRAWIRQQMEKRLTNREYTNLLAPRDAA